jgi:cyclophilin family peptidyl-prolyl cis-trans isomerase
VALTLALLALPTSAAIEDCQGDLTPSSEDNPVLALETPLGSICIELLVDQAPIAVGNFMAYIESQAWRNTFFHRSVAGFVVQGGGFTADANGLFQRVIERAPTLNEPCTLDQEISPGLEICSLRGNERGTLAMAKVGDPFCSQFPGQCVSRPDYVTTFSPAALYVNSATNEWFINLMDNRSNLDNQNGGFTVFARVLGNGMSIADLIGDAVHYPAAHIPYSFDADPQTLVFSLGSLPLQAVVNGPVPVYGCFDVDDLAALLETVIDATVPSGSWATDPELDRIQMVSANCGTFLTNRSDYVATASESQTCITADQLGVQAVDGADLQLYFDPDEQTAPTFQFTCQEIQDSVAGLAARRAELSPLIAAQLMTVQVPEPSSLLMSSTSLAIIGAVGASRRRHWSRKRR